MDSRSFIELLDRQVFKKSDHWLANIKFGLCLQTISISGEKTKTFLDEKSSFDSLLNAMYRI